MMKSHLEHTDLVRDFSTLIHEILGRNPELGYVVVTGPLGVTLKP
jgi:hypothetical protein